MNAPAPAGLGGRLRTEPEDFEVEELPLFRPTGEGPQVIAQVEKRGITTLDALLFLSKAAHVSERSIGYAGLKDARALTRQFVSLPRSTPEQVLALAGPRYRVLSAVRHPHGLKIGHLKGNRFTIRIRDANLAGLAAARAQLEDLGRRGMPNPYGGQRFGSTGQAHLMGRALLEQQWATFLDLLLGQPTDKEDDPRARRAREAWQQGQREAALAAWPIRRRSEKRALSALLRGASPEQAVQALGPHPRRIWVSAWQSWLFNRVLAQREAQGTWDRLLPGDIAWLHATSATYLAGDGAEEAQRSAALQASPTGPLPGYDLRLAQGAPGEVERAVLREAGSDPEAFRAAHARMRGSRRPLRVPVREASLEVEGPRTVRVRFVLPPGAFATVLLGLLMDPPASPSTDAGAAAHGDGDGPHAALFGDED